MATEIHSWEDLDAIRDDLTETYTLETDLTSDDEDYEGIGDDWSFIDDFDGVLYGQGHMIEGLTGGAFISSVDLTSGIIQNLEMANVDVEADPLVIEAGSIERVLIEGESAVLSAETDIGAIQGGDITKCLSIFNYTETSSNVYGLRVEAEHTIEDSFSNMAIDVEGTENGRVAGELEDFELQSLALYTDNEFGDFPALEDPWDMEDVEDWSGEDFYIHDGETYPSLGAMARTLMNSQETVAFELMTNSPHSKKNGLGKTKYEHLDNIRELPNRVKRLKAGEEMPSAWEDNKKGYLLVAPEENTKNFGSVTSTTFDEYE